MILTVPPPVEATEVLSAVKVLGSPFPNTREPLITVMHITTMHHAEITVPPLDTILNITPTSPQLFSIEPRNKGKESIPVLPIPSWPFLQFQKIPGPLIRFTQFRFTQFRITQCTDPSSEPTPVGSRTHSTPKGNCCNSHNLREFVPGPIHKSQMELPVQHRRERCRLRKRRRRPHPPCRRCLNHLPWHNRSPLRH